MLGLAVRLAEVLVSGADWLEQAVKARTLKARVARVA